MHTTSPPLDATRFIKTYLLTGLDNTQYVSVYISRMRLHCFTVGTRDRAPEGERCAPGQASSSQLPLRVKADRDVGDLLDTQP